MLSARFSLTFGILCAMMTVMVLVVVTVVGQGDSDDRGTETLNQNQFMDLPWTRLGPTSISSLDIASLERSLAMCHFHGRPTEALSREELSALLGWQPLTPTGDLAPTTRFGLYASSEARLNGAASCESPLWPGAPVEQYPESRLFPRPPARAQQRRIGGFDVAVWRDSGMGPTYGVLETGEMFNGEQIVAKVTARNETELNELINQLSLTP